ncbi:GCFC-domain-containing protein [Chiua virens]|nr:GCFC-domain-containing protein [Chiua virens]
MSDKVLFKKSASRPAQRVRDVDAEPDNDEPSTSSILASKFKSRSKRAQPKSRLSFGVDDEATDEPSFQIKKSSLSRQLTLGSHPASLPATLDQATISNRSNGAPVYDQAHLSELKASTYSVRPPANNDAYDVNVSMIVDEAAFEISELPGKISASRHGALRSCSPEGAETVIPSQSRIVAAKERRERLRTGTAEQEYISLTVTKRSDVLEGPHPESRLVREEDEVGEGDDEYAEYTSAQERIALGKKARKADASKRRDTMKEMIADGQVLCLSQKLYLIPYIRVDEDEETLKWEREQLRRGGHDPAMASTPHKEVYKAARIPASTDVPALGPAIERFERTLASLSDSHALNTSAIASLVEQRTELDTRETELRSMIAAAESKRSWFTEFKDWVESVAAFLDEKFPALEKLEEEYLSILKERAVMIARRRVADDKDDLSVVYGPVPEPSALSDNADELHGVPTNPVILRRERCSAREARRSRRRASKMLSNIDDREEGYSTDSSLLPSDALDYQNALERIATDSRDILSDVRSVEFKDPNRGLAKWFSEWRERYADSYGNAWGGLALVGAWEFWVRLEILGWNPFEASSFLPLDIAIDLFSQSAASLDQFTWYSSLYQYSHPVRGIEKFDEAELGSEGDMVSAMISTAVVPRLCKILEAVLDPYSAKDVRTVIDLAEQVEASIGIDNNKFQIVLKSVHTTFEKAMSNAGQLLVPYLNLANSPFDPEMVPSRQRLLSRAVKLLENMLRWRKYAGDKHAVGKLCAQLINDYIFPIAETGWEVGGERKVRQVMALLPPELASSTRAMTTLFT